MNDIMTVVFTHGYILMPPLLGRISFAFCKSINNLYTGTNCKAKTSLRLIVECQSCWHITSFIDQCDSGCFTIFQTKRLSLSIVK
jgi:hypothetical protein